MIRALQALQGLQGPLEQTAQCLGQQVQLVLQAQQVLQDQRVLTVQSQDQPDLLVQPVQTEQLVLPDLRVRQVPQVLMVLLEPQDLPVLQDLPELAHLSY